jgi:predicted phage gp36 major capsid-like protein
MPPQSLVKRVENLENRVTTLEQLPARVDALASQISELRDEMRIGFSAIESKIQAGDEETRRVLREEIRAGDSEVVRLLGDEIHSTRDKLLAAREDDRREVRMLHEEVLSRIALLREGPPKARSRKREV